MANASESESALRNCVNDLQSDLQKAVSIIDNLTNVNKPSTTSQTQTLPSSQSLFEEHKRLFSPYHQTNHGARHGRQSVSTTRSVNPTQLPNVPGRYEPPKIGNSSSSTRKRKRCASSENKRCSNARRYMWTHRFVCLSDSENYQCPALDEKINLKNAGLGEVEITFEKDGNAEHFHDKLLETFPKLKNCGGYEVLRTVERSSHKLEVINCPRSGYSVPVLKECLNQAKGYIRPVQCDLSMEPIEIDCGLMLPKTQCWVCGMEFPIGDIRSHLLQCSVDSGTKENPIILQNQHNKVDEQSDQSQGPPSGKKTQVHLGVEEKQLCLDKKVPGIGLETASCSSSFQEPQQSTNEDVEKDDLEKLTYLFPSHDQTEFLAIYHKNGGDINSAIDDILNHQEQGEGCQEIDVIKLYKKKVVRGIAYIDFNRMQLSTLRQVLRIYKNPDLDLCKPPDINFQGEQGTDMGGPTKEFFHIAMSCLNKVDPCYKLQLFSGEPGHLVPLCGVDALSTGCFIMTGKLLAHSILHGGCGFLGMAPALVKYLETGSIEEALTLVTTADVPDVELRTLLEEKILGQASLAALSADEKGQIEDVMVKHGLIDIPITEFNKGKAVQDLMVSEVLVTRVLALDQMFQGMNSLGLGELFRKHPQLSKILFPTLKDHVIDPVLFQDKLHLSDETDVENEAKKKGWEWFLQFVKESFLVTDQNTNKPLIDTLLVFMSGEAIVDASSIYEVKFNEDDKMTLLQADSCFNRVIIPWSHSSYSHFKEACVTSLTYGAVGYGRF